MTLTAARRNTKAIAAPDAATADVRFTLRPAEARGRADFGWLDSRHSFSFGQYVDPAHMGFSNLRVINDDRVAGGGGFPPHPHKDAEIFSYVLDGALEHKDNMNAVGSTVGAGGVQYMSAGTGVTHSEFNPSATEPVRFLQVWLMPDREGETPRYDTLDISPEAKDGKLALFLSRDGRYGSMRTYADANVYAATLHGDQVIETAIPAGRSGWVQVARGNLRVGTYDLKEGDGLAIRAAGPLRLERGGNAEVLVFDLPA